MTVRIVTLDRGFSVTRWLCDRHIAEAKRKGWEEEGRKPLTTGWPCEECVQERAGCEEGASDVR